MLHEKVCQSNPENVLIILKVLKADNDVNIIYIIR